MIRLRNIPSAIIFLCFSHSAFSNIIGENIISNSCSKNYNKFYNCNFSNYISHSLTNTKSFSLPMDFTISYSRGFCANRFENGRFQSDYFNLKIQSGISVRHVIPGNNKLKISGNSLQLIDLDPKTSFSTEYYSPCYFIIKKVEIDFNQESKEKINQIQLNIESSKNAIFSMDNIKLNISKLLITLNQMDLENAQENLSLLIQNIQYLISINSSVMNELNANDSLSKLNILYSKILTIKSYSKENIEYKKIVGEIKKIVSLLDKIISATSDSFQTSESTSNYHQYEFDDVYLRTILQEIEREPNFNTSSIQKVKSILQEREK
ncbi:hypothetical protein QEJ31_05420 [Pigmentibacter sp. JX0631]|uniref:hypothetical protein n=1 Tax=Pigmentibacter sp. JX0631 TaxID=2976982 RepID=UPI0024684585|nr:hypothetical protein [Pigmentibacter sp. JX0631]WGL61033.1 hypothetical protein QEJ31_05420 [Pigmentibacter sp. JX0631]